MSNAVLFFYSNTSRKKYCDLCKKEDMDLITAMAVPDNHDYLAMLAEPWTVVCDVSQAEPSRRPLDGRQLIWLLRSGGKPRRRKARVAPPVRDSPDRIRITESEAAQLAGCPRKTLGNMRRSGAIPRDCYWQNTRGGKIYYNKKKLEEFFNSNFTPARRPRS